jgi:hypothetical protein
MTTSVTPASVPSVGLRTAIGGRGVLVLSLVHPDLLPSVHALALVLRDAGYLPTIVSFASPVPGRYAPGHGITLLDCGPHTGSHLERIRRRRAFRALACRTCEALQPDCLIATCPFSYLLALRIAGSRPVVYLVQEIYTFGAADFRRSPVSSFRSWRAERRLGEAALLAAPSPERAGFIAARAKLDRLPTTILNCPYLDDAAGADERLLEGVLPARVRQGVLVVSTGRVSHTQAIRELVESVRFWPVDARLAITGVDESPYGRSVRAARDASTRRDDIALLPMLPRDAMLALQSRAAVGICLLRADHEPAAKMPAPNKVGEYLRWGAFIVASRLPFLDTLPALGVAELADHLEPSEIGRAVAAAVERARDPGTRETVRACSRSWYNMGVQAAPILSLLDGQADERRPSARDA